jgi:hypothetical protein
MFQAGCKNTIKNTNFKKIEKDIQITRRKLNEEIKRL